MDSRCDIMRPLKQKCFLLEKISLLLDSKLSKLLFYLCSVGVMLSSQLLSLSIPSSLLLYSLSVCLFVSFSPSLCLCLCFPSLYRPMPFYICLSISTFLSGFLTLWLSVIVCVCLFVYMSLSFLYYTAPILSLAMYQLPDCLDLSASLHLLSLFPNLIHTRCSHAAAAAETDARTVTFTSSASSRSISEHRLQNE